MSTWASLVRGFWVVVVSCLTVLASAQPSAPRLTAVAEPARAEALGAAAADFAALGMADAAAVYANHPPLAQALGPHLRYIVSGSTLAPRERSLVGLRAVWLARSPYLWAHLAPLAREAGLSADEVRRVAAGPDAGWNGFDATLLRAADELHVDAMLFRQCRSGGNDGVHLVSGVTAERLRRPPGLRFATTIALVDKGSRPLANY